MSGNLTAEQLQAKLSEVKSRLEEEEAHTAELQKEVHRAGHRYYLRREIAVTESKIAKRKDLNEYHVNFRGRVDRDDTHPCLHFPDGPHGSDDIPSQKMSSGHARKHVQGDSVHCSDSVVKKEYEWRIAGLSWLENALKQEDSSCVESELFRIAYGVHEDCFDMVYSPGGGVVGLMTAAGQQRGSLALRHLDEHGITMRYKIFIRDDTGNFIQWGDTGNECHPDWAEEPKAFGPDVQMVKRGCHPDKQIGIWGLSYKDLLTSKWVQNDTLTVKVEVFVRPPVEIDVSRDKVDIDFEMPPPSLQANLVSLLTSEKHSDVTFIVEGERIKAHSVILCARSEVFDRELNCGMQEALTKEVKVVDCDPVAFKVMLRFIYSDDLDAIWESIDALDDKSGAASSSGSKPKKASVAPGEKVPLLQHLLAMSHKYQINRLHVWCERELSKFLCVNEVCHVLCQAHLYQATQLENTCLAWIKANLSAVVVKPAFSAIAKDWPEVQMKINMYLAGLTGAETTRVMEEHWKRPTGESNEESSSQPAKRKRTE